MSLPGLSLKFALVLSVSFAASYTTYSSSSSPFSIFAKSSSRLSSTNHSPTPKATPSDLLSLLGTPQQASSVNPAEAKELRSCFKFLVPFSPPPAQAHPSPLACTSSPRRLLRSKFTDVVNQRSRSEENQLIWWPPVPVMELARLAIDSGGDPDAIYRALDPSIIPVPDVEECRENRCELTRTPYGRRFIKEDLNLYLKFLFELIVARGPSIGLNVSLSRFDLFHGHIFLATGSGRLGILFHAREYPVYDKEVFPYNMGYCQIGSNVAYNDLMNLRNILWLAPMPISSTNVTPGTRLHTSLHGVLVVLDAHPDGIIYRDIIPDYVNYARTIYEDDLGDVVADVNFLNIGSGKPDYRIFIC